jgi:galactarate dehydratase
VLKREELPLSALMVGSIAGAATPLPGISANPSAGYAADCWRRPGHVFCFSEVTEVRDGVQLLAPARGPSDSDRQAK